MTLDGVSSKRRLILAVFILAALVTVLGGLVIRDLVTGRTPWTRVADGGGQ